MVADYPISEARAYEQMLLSCPKPESYPDPIGEFPLGFF